MSDYKKDVFDKFKMIKMSL